MEAVRSGQLTPMFFGSAMSNFGVQLFLESFISLASPPGGRPCGSTLRVVICLFPKSFISLALPPGGRPCWPSTGADICFFLESFTSLALPMAGGPC